jgi:hypothetical protein
MAQQTKNVVAASPVVTGGVLWAPPGTALPTNATTALDGDFVALGYVGEDGVQPSGDPASTTDIPAWGGDVVAQLLESASVARYTFKLIEILSGDVAEFVFGEDNVTITPATISAGTKLAINDVGAEPPDGILAFEMFYKSKKLRIILPAAQSLVISEDPLVHTGLTAYEIQTTALKDDAGNRRYLYFENDDLVPA